MFLVGWVSQLRHLLPVLGGCKIGGTLHAAPSSRDIERGTWECCERCKDVPDLFLGVSGVEPRGDEEVDFVFGLQLVQDRLEVILLTAAQHRDRRRRSEIVGALFQEFDVFRGRGALE